MYFTAMYAIQLFDMLRANITAQVSYTDCIRSAQSSDHRCNEQKIAFNELLTLISSQFIYFISFGSIAYVLFFYSFCAFNFDLIYCTEDKMNDILCSQCSHRWFIHFFSVQLFFVLIQFESLTTVQNVINIDKQLLQKTSYRNAY